MNATNLFSMSVIAKDLGLVLVAVSNGLQNAGITYVNCISLKNAINVYWDRYSLIEGIEVDVIPDCSQVEGYEILVHRIDDPHILLSINYNLS